MVFSKDFYTANIQSYLTFYMIDKFGMSVASSQYVLFAFLVSTAIGLLIGGEVGDRYGHKYVIWFSILGSSPFALLLPYCNMTWTRMNMKKISQQPWMSTVNPAFSS